VRALAWPVFRLSLECPINIFWKTFLIGYSKEKELKSKQQGKKKWKELKGVEVVGQLAAISWHEAGAGGT